MLAWLRENASLLELASSIGMLAVWLLYLQLFFRSYQRQRQPNLLIHQTNGFDLDGLCMVANMSESNVHVEAVLVDARRDDEIAVFQPAPTTPANTQAGEDPLHASHEGPLAQGAYVTIGRFRALVAEAEEKLPEAPAGEELMVTVRVVAFVGPELHPVGARRTFRVDYRDTDAEVRPTSLVPEQFSTRRQRSVARSWLEEAQSLDRARVLTSAHEQEIVERFMEAREEPADAEPTDR